MPSPPEQQLDFTVEPLTISHRVRHFTWNQIEVIEEWTRYDGFIDGLIRLPKGDVAYARMTWEDLGDRHYVAWNLELDDEYDELPEEFEDLVEWLTHPKVDVFAVITLEHYNTVFPYLHGSKMVR